MTDDRPDRLSHENVRSVLQAWFSSHTRDSFPWVAPKPEHVEVGVAFVLDERVGGCLCGHRGKEHGTKGCDLCLCSRYQDKIAHVAKLDLISTSKQTRALAPVDHKTTGQINSRFIHQFEMDSQLTGYCWDASQWSGEPVRVAYVNAIELSVLPSSDRKCATHGVKYAECGAEHLKTHIGLVERTDRQIEEWRDTAIKLALQYRRLLTYTHAEIHDVRTEGTFNGSCGFCEFREFCLSDRPANQIDRMFTLWKWAPWERALGRDGKQRKPDPRTFYVDNSILKATASCSTQALMRYGWGLSNTEQSGPSHAGTCVHLALEVWNKGGTVDEALEAFDSAFLADGGARHG